jgi:cytochrome c oxidase cbb3-type subunit 3
MSSHVSLFIVVFTLVNILACVWLLWWTARDRGSQQHAASADGMPERTGHVWDGDLEEYNNPLPRWWLGVFIITVLFGAVYLYLFPGLGSFAGAKNWTSVGQYEEQMARQRALLDQQLASLHGASLDQLAANPAAMAMAKNLFGANCSTCHGSDARGAKGFPNLTDGDWLWGGAGEAVHETIANGRHAVMPALGAVLGDEGVNEVASYVLSLSGVQAPADWVAAGKERFAMVCAACHGADATGNQLLGAPNLTDKTWLFGGDFAAVSATIREGRESTMPAHTPLLGDAKVRLLAAYVLNLSASRVAQSPPDAGAAGGNGGAP